MAGGHGREATALQLAPRLVKDLICVLRVRTFSGNAGTGMRVIVGFFGLCAPDVLTAHVAVCSHVFTRFDRFIQLVTSSIFT
jgi:hypothetical protein